MWLVERNHMAIDPRSAITGMGQSRRFDDVRATSALPLITDLRQKDRHVRLVPLPDIADGYIGSSSTPENSKWPG